MDPIKRMFAELAEANGKVRVRYSGLPDGAREDTMSYRQYRVWLDQAPKLGLKLEWVEQVKAPHG